jgi:periplasmic copper chaperone A
MMKAGKLIQWSAGVAVACLAWNAQAAQTQAAGVQAEQCWVRAMPASVPSAGYFTLRNNGDETVTLSGVATPAFGMAMMHRSESNGSMSSMEMVSSVPVTAHGSVSFAPSGYHVMLEQPAKPLKIGATLLLTLSFADGSSVSANCAIKPAATLGQPAQ